MILPTKRLGSDVKNQIDSWYATVKKEQWQNLEDVRKIYRDAEAVGNFTVFNIRCICQATQKIHKDNHVAENV